MYTRKTRSAFRAGEAGFTLLEAIIAMAILTFGILTVCVMQAGALRASTTAFKRTEANNVAVALVEAFQQLPSDDPMLKMKGNGQKTSDYENGQREKLRTVTLKGGVTENGKGVLPSMRNVMEGSADVAVHRCRNSNKKCGSDEGGQTNLETLLEPVFEVIADGKVMDRTGTVFELAWAVQDVEVKGIEKNGVQEATDKLIRVYMRWDTPMGIKNHLEFTTNKFSKDFNE